jgi:two-component system NtrC family sensor kinase
MLRTKLFQAFAGLVIVFGVLAVFVGSRMIKNRIVGEAQNQVTLDLNSAWAIFNSRLETLNTIVDMVAIKRVVVDTATLNDWASEDVHSRLENIRRTFGLDFLTVISPEAKVVLRTAPNYKTGDMVLHKPAVARALRGEHVYGLAVLTAAELEAESADLPERAYLQIEPTPKARPSPRTVEDRGLVMMAAAPIMKGPTLLGVVYGGILLNRNNELVDRIASTIYRDESYKGSPLGTATLFLGDCRIATTVRLPNGNRAVGTRVSKEVADRVLDNATPWVGPAFVVKDWYLTAYDPVRDLDGRVVGMLYVGRLQQPFKDIGRAFLMRYAILFTFGIASALILAFIIAGRLADPIHQLVDAADRMRRGEGYVEVAVRSSCEEIEHLVESFNVMARTLKEREAHLTEARDALARQNEEIRALNRNYMDMLGFVSHELKSPVASIMNYAFLLGQRKIGDLTPQQEKAVRNIEHNAKRMVEMVRHYLNLSRIENHELTPISTRVAVLDEVVRPLLDTFERDLQDRHIRVENSIPADLILHADLNMTREVFENLVSNAIKYGRENGVISLNARTEDGWAEFAVRNEGNGIPSDKIPYVFQKFARLESDSQTRREKGTGLGLFITKHIVEAHGGHIEVESKPSEWVEFRFRLPRSVEEKK